MVKNFLKKDSLDDTRILEISIEQITDEEIRRYIKEGKVKTTFKKANGMVVGLTPEEIEKRKQEIETILAYHNGEKVSIKGKLARHFIEEEKRKQKLSKTIHSNVGEKIKKHNGNKYGWIRNLKRGEVKFDKPVVLFLGGNSVSSDENANGYAKALVRAMGRVGVTDNDIQILSAYYPKFKNSEDDITQTYLNTKDESIEETFKNPEYVKDVYEAIIRPVLFKNSRGEIQNPAKIAKKLRNLTIVSHCYGSVIATLLLKNLSEDMQNIKFTKEEIEQCIGEIVNISVSPRIGYFEHNKESKNLTIGFVTADDDAGHYRYANICDGYMEDPKHQWKGIYRSSMSVGLEENSEYNQYLYRCGDTYDYSQGTTDITDMNFGHSLNCYTDENNVAVYAVDENEKFKYVRTHKNENGKNFCRLVCRSIQNAVSLSVMDEKRTIEEIVSNNTPITFKQGAKEDNPNTVGVRFDGNNTEFERNYEKQVEKVKKLKALWEATRKLDTMSKNENKQKNQIIGKPNKER